MDSQCVTDVLFLVSLYLNFSSRSYSPSSDLPPLLGVSSWWVKTGHCYPPPPLIEGGDGGGGGRLLTLRMQMRMISHNID